MCRTVAKGPTDAGLDLWLIARRISIKRATTVVGHDFFFLEQRDLIWFLQCRGTSAKCASNNERTVTRSLLNLAKVDWDQACVACCPQGSGQRSE